MPSLLKDFGKLRRDRFVAVFLEGRVLQWCSVTKSTESLKKTECGQLELPPPADDDNAEAREAALDALRIQAVKDGVAGKVAVGMESTQLLLRVISLPDVADDELSSMVQLQVDKVSPFPIETMVYSYEVLEKKDGKCRILIAAVKDELVRGLGDSLRPLGLVPKRVDAAVMGWVQLLNSGGHVLAKGRQAVLLIDGVSLPEIIIFQDGIPILFRLVSEVEGLTGADFVAEAARAVGYTIMSLEMEHGGEPCAMQLWTRGSMPEELAQSIRTECGCEVDSFSLDDLGLISEGLARRSAVQGSLDLIPAAWQAETDAALFKKRAMVGFGAAFGAWALFALLIFGGSFLQEKRLEHYKGVQAEWRQNAKEVGDMRRRVVMVKRYLDNSQSSLECLREITAAMPTGVSLTSFSYKRADRIKISAEATSSTDVYEFKNRVDASKLFKGSTLNGPRRNPQRGKELFELEVKLSEGDGEP